jgi:hypothetical protein
MAMLHRWLLLTAISFASALSAASLESIRLTKHGWSACEPPVSAFSFSSNDSHARLWFVVTEVAVGDVGYVEWLQPNGQVFKRGSYNPASNGGRWCMGDQLSISGYPAANLYGQWRVRVLWQGGELASVPFNINGGDAPIQPIPTTWEFKANSPLIGQEADWSCGPTTIAMWVGTVAAWTPNQFWIADSCCGSDGTTIPEFLRGLYDWTPYGYVYSEWEYKNKYAAVKSIMWSIAQLNEPIAVAGGSGTHYVLVKGGRADRNPYFDYSADNHIRGVWVNDSTEISPHYGYPVSGMYSYKEYNPSTLMEYWLPIGGFFDKKYRAIRRNCFACWDRQGKTYEWNDEFSDY